MCGGVLRGTSLKEPALFVSLCCNHPVKCLRVHACMCGIQLEVEAHYQYPQPFLQTEPLLIKKHHHYPGKSAQAGWARMSMSLQDFSPVMAKSPELGNSFCTTTCLSIVYRVRRMHNHLLVNPISLRIPEIAATSSGGGGRFTIYCELQFVFV